MAKIVGLPKLSPTMEEGTLAKWVKKEGDALAVDDLVAEVETDKATMEWRALDKGVLLKILVPEGTTLKPDQPVAIIGNAGEDISALVAQASGGASAPSDAGPAAAPESGSRAPVSGPASGSGSPAPVSGSGSGPGPGSASGSPAPESGRVAASPLVRKLARENDIDLRTVTGTGPHGRIIKRDLDGAEHGTASKAAAAAPKSSATFAFSGGASGSFERLEPVRQPVSQMRKVIARRLTESKQTVPHFYLTIDVDAQPLLDARAVINTQLEESGVKISVNDLIVKACAIALRRVPECNASFMGTELLFHQVVDISVAVAVPDGLLTPVVRDADKKGVAAISAEIKELAGRAKNKKLKPEEMQNGTFSISNLGMFGIENFSAVINPPEGAILAVGTVRDEPIVKDGAIVAGKRMRMTLSCDHRVVDGAVGAKYLAALKKILEAPISMIV
ncbi:MAG: pyruvate dehydrogenase complex dihydrolipoamide acetyltransferase [Deltaproteobacteria bacterium]|nr:pyruvate dehydrogenase complex dihydrolipoamide acetyltransferase [Deltaproteobacteria bacterium]